MIRLNLPREPYWLEMPSGIRVKVRPLRTPINETAKARMRRLAKELVEHAAAIRAVGGTVDDLPDMATDDGLTGATMALYGESLAVAGIIEWEGVGDADAADEGAALPLTPDAITEWMAQYPGDADAFVLMYTAPINRAIAEGNVSRPSPNGTSAAGRNTARGAGMRTMPARGAT